MGIVYFYNDDNADLYLTVVDEYAKATVIDDKFLASDRTESAEVELSEGEGLISWYCYRRKDNNVTGQAENVEVGNGETVDVST